jgi:hypothetical protein
MFIQFETTFKSFKTTFNSFETSSLSRLKYKFNEKFSDNIYHVPIDFHNNQILIIITICINFFTYIVFFFELVFYL